MMGDPVGKFWINRILRSLKIVFSVNYSKLDQKVSSVMHSGDSSYRKFCSFCPYYHCSSS